jgi:hypothetical protein
VIPDDISDAMTELALIAEDEREAREEFQAACDRWRDTQAQLIIRRARLDVALATITGED